MSDMDQTDSKIVYRLLDMAETAGSQTDRDILSLAAVVVRNHLARQYYQAFACKIRQSRTSPLEKRLEAALKVTGGEA